MCDFLIRGLNKTSDVRFALANTSNLVQSGIIAHNCDPYGGYVFADALSATALLAVLLDENERFSIKIDYPSETGSIILDVDSKSHVRGLISNSQLAAAKDNEDLLFGTSDALVTIFKFSDGKVLNSGQVKCGLGKASANIAMFFSLSDQIESEIVTVTKFQADEKNPVKISSSFMLQAMPDCDLNEFAQIREKIYSKEFLTILADDKITWQIKTEKLLQILQFENSTYELTHTPEFACRCSRETMQKALLTLGKAELTEIFEKQSTQELKCHFCNKSYIFTKEDIEA